ncbi:hypothetical protein AV521_31895 [Streptomyces sp. IMTB 2501]|uniref:hypothetical protein n=1 Tax=Streptomyces sp. IMTB 2501 TaxID=1776340 RepID=UPI00096F6E3C|nr:hypothetical protein [Streptomyces sp. IMTB 2501]OLZ65299.1 hypothetical protein AV521_31895 [Streptomyces sp. IMTB 2501]
MSYPVSRCLRRSPAWTLKRQRPEATDLNHDMLKVFHDLSLRVTRHFDGPEVRRAVELTEDETYLNAVGARARVADVISMRPCCGPAPSP